MSAESERAQTFDAWLWSLSAQRLSQVEIRGLAKAAVDDGVDLPQLTFLTVIAQGADPFVRLHAAGAATVRDAKTFGDGGLLLNGLGRQEYVVAFWPTGEEGVYHLMSSAPVTDRKWRLVEDKWVRGMRYLAPVLLDKEDFEAIGDGLTEHGRVEVSRLAARVLRDHSSYTRGWQSAPDRVRPTHRDALGETEGMLVRTLTLSMQDLTVHLRRVAGATFYRGDYQLFVDRVLQRLVTAAAQRNELLSGRARQPRKPVTEALAIALDAPVLDGPEGREVLLESLNHLSGVQTAVFHSNPYLHLIATDYADGSSFDILATDSDRLEVIPGFRASVASMSRITEAIGTALGMSVLEEQDIPELIPDQELISG